MARSSPSARRSAREKYKAAVKSSPPGGGARFKAVEDEAEASGARNPAAVAAAVGRKKYGKARFQKMASKGRKNSK